MASIVWSSLIISLLKRIKIVVNIWVVVILHLLHSLPMPERCRSIYHLSYFLICKICKSKVTFSHFLKDKLSSFTLHLTWYWPTHIVIYCRLQVLRSQTSRTQRSISTTTMTICSMLFNTISGGRRQLTSSIIIMERNWELFLTSLNTLLITKQSSCNIICRRSPPTQPRNLAQYSYN